MKNSPESVSGEFFYGLMNRTDDYFSIASCWYPVLTGRVTRMGLLASSG